MHQSDSSSTTDAPNHPKSLVMALVASLAFNIGVGSIMGTPGVLLPHMKVYLGVSTEMVSAGALALIASSAFFAPQIGALAVKRSLRGILAMASLMLGGAWLILAFTHSYPIYLAAYAFLLGPAMAVTGSVLAPTLVTRWFNRNRGLAIGLVHLPIMVAIMPIVTEWLIQRIGLQSTFLVLAVLPLVTLLPASFLIIDWPPSQHEAAGGVQPAASQSHGPTVTIWQMLCQPRFWLLTIAVAMPNTSSIMLGQHLVSMAESWGIQPLAAAGLASIMSLVGMIGSVALGLVADRLGGARTLALMAAGDMVLWLLFLVHPPYAGLAVIIGLIGLCGAGAVPAISKAYADAFGRASFSRAIGLMAPAMMPMMAVGLIGPGMAVRLYGSYTMVIVGMAGAFGVALLSALAAGYRQADAGGVATPA